MAEDSPMENAVEYSIENLDPNQIPQSDTATREPDKAQAYPEAILKLDEKHIQGLKSWLDTWLETLISEQQPKIQQWADEERAYRALSEMMVDGPYENSCGDVVPAIAMAVDPIQARLSTGIFKSDPVFRLKPLRRGFVKIAPSLEKWIEYYQKYKLNLRNLLAPRLFEFAKHGTMVLKTIYDRDTYKIKSYNDQWEVVDKEVTRFSGPRVIGLPLPNVLFPARYQFAQDCPIIAERLVTTMSDLLKMQASKKVANVKDLEGQETYISNQLEQEQQLASNHQETVEQTKLYIELFEVWCAYDIDGDGIPESLVVTYHKPTQTIIQLRYNWYFHQRKPYTLIPYTVAANSLYGIGIGEMMMPFQQQLTTWHRIATDNAYLANIRMFVTQKDSGIENRPKLFGGRVFRVDDPRKDFIPFAAADIYPSTLGQQQNLFGMAEKRTGISDYLTGRESPIIGSRATATSTLALIQEGTRRVEEVLENIRNGLAEVMQNCMSIWIQYGLDGLDDVVFADDQITKDIREFFNQVHQENVDGSLAIDLAATDAANNRTAQQQIQLAIVQMMMQYLEKLVQIAQLAFQSQQQAPELVPMYVDIMTAARNMFRDLLQKYNVPNPDDYLPELEKYFNDAVKAATAGAPGATAGGAAGQGGLEGILASIVGGQGIQGGPAGGGSPAPNGGPRAPQFDRSGGFVPGSGNDQGLQ